MEHSFSEYRRFKKPKSSRSKKIGLPESLIIILEIRSTFLATLSQITLLPEIPITYQFDIPIRLSRQGRAIIPPQPFVY
jgi:hypothetical protein